MDKKIVIKLILPILVLALAALFIFLMVPAKDGWSTLDNQVVYILDGEPVTGWQQIDGNRYYFGESGTLHTGWQEIDQDCYYFGDDGILYTGWLDAHYFQPDGKLATDWTVIDGKLYYLGEDGTLKKGIVDTADGTYLLTEQGYIAYGWAELGDRLYYADSEGHPVQGWQTIDGKQHYFEESGVAAAGWMDLDGVSCYFYMDGSPAQGKLVIDGQTHYFASAGQHLLLVNPWNFVPEDYTVDLTPINNTHSIATVAYEDYLEMITDCEEAGFTPAVCSSYRTHEYQDGLYQNRIDRYVWAGYSEEEATELAGQSVAVPGTSEHQLGLALDIVDTHNWRLDESQAKMPTQQWLMSNSWRYGWILRYPSEKSDYTGIIYEPWHYRYVGKTIAREIHELDVCLEEYLEMLTNSVG